MLKLSQTGWGLSLKSKDFFHFIQLLFLAFIGASVFQFWFRNRSEGVGGDPFERERSKLKRELFKAMMNAKNKNEVPRETRRPSAQSPKLSLSSALPNWDARTPASEVLGVPAGSAEDVIENAYRRKVKLYHPDRFQSWGKEYEARAHEILIFLQSARKNLLGTKFKK